MMYRIFCLSVLLLPAFSMLVRELFTLEIVLEHRPLSLIFANVEALASSSEGGATGGHSLECGKGTIKLCKAKCGRCQVELEVWGAGSPVILHCPLDR